VVEALSVSEKVHHFAYYQQCYKNPWWQKTFSKKNTGTFQCKNKFTNGKSLFFFNEK
jgi:hypothetical protein